MGWYGMALRPCASSSWALVAVLVLGSSGACAELSQCQQGRVRATLLGMVEATEREERTRDRARGRDPLDVSIAVGWSLIREGGFSPHALDTILSDMPPGRREQDSALYRVARQLVAEARAGRVASGQLVAVVPVSLAYLQRPEEGAQGASLVASWGNGLDRELAAVGRAIHAFLLECMRGERLKRRLVATVAERCGHARVAESVLKVRTDRPVSLGCGEARNLLCVVLRAWYRSSGHVDAINRLGRNVPPEGRALLGALSGAYHGPQALRARLSWRGTGWRDAHELVSCLLDLAGDNVLLVVPQEWTPLGALAQASADGKARSRSLSTGGARSAGSAERYAQGTGAARRVLPRGGGVLVEDTAPRTAADIPLVQLSCGGE